jgi:hypothetical protein
VGTGPLLASRPQQAADPVGYLQAILAEAARQGEVVAEATPSGPDNPLVTAAAPQPWPKPLDPDAWARRQAAAGQVEEARRRHARTGSYEPAGGAQQLLLDAEEVVAGWDSDIDKLLAELAAARSGEQGVPLPETLSATAVLRLTEDPDGYAADLARPMPRPPSRAARFGTRFHAWVEHYFGPRLGSGGLGQQQLVDPDDLPDRVDAGTEDEAELRELCEAFVAGRFGASAPYAVEAPFSLLLGGRLVRGRIDAIFRLPDDAEGRAPLAGGRLEDQPARRRRPAAAGALPAGLGRGAAGAAGAGRRGLLPRPLRPAGASARARGPTRARGAAARPPMTAPPAVRGDRAGGGSLRLSPVTTWVTASDLDRVDHHRRSTDWVAGLWRAPDAKLLKLRADGKFTTKAGGTRLRMTKPFVEFDSQRHRLLGLLQGAPIFAVEALTEGEVHDLREVGACCSESELDIAAAATAVLNWHRMESLCPRCGGRPRVINGGFARHCTACGEDHFPRTDPAVIVAVRRRGRPAAAGWPGALGRPRLGAGRVRRGGGVRRAGHPPRDRRGGRRGARRAALLRQPAVAVPAVAHARLLRPGHQHGPQRRHRRDQPRRLVLPRRAHRRPRRGRASPCRAPAPSPRG